MKYFHRTLFNNVRKLENITKISFRPAPDSRNLKLSRMHYIQNGHKKKWDILKTRNNMNVLLYNTERQKLVLLMEFRPSVYYNVIKSKVNEHEIIDLEKYPPSLGTTIELCCCFSEPEIPYTDTIKEFIWRKCGYKILPEKLEEILTYSSGVGTSSARQKLYYCEVSDKEKYENPDKANVLECSVAEAEALFKTKQLINGTVAFLFGILWALRFRIPHSFYSCKNK